MRLLPAVTAAVGLLAGQVCGQYHDGLGLMDGLVPRSWPLAVAKPPALGKRDGSCASGSHPCSDVNSTSCCSNEQYCIINTSWEVQCCEIGSVCGNPCDAAHYYANETITTTIPTSASLTAVVTTTITGICSGRSCTGSLYGCPSSLGGQCCAFGLNCATNTAGAGICIGVSSAASTTTSSTSATGSSTSSALPTGAIIEHESSSLSTGAKAGIAVGVIVVAALVIGALTYLCLRRRRRGARSETTSTAQELPAGRGTAAAAAAVVTTASRPQMSEAEGDALSYRYTPSSTGLSRAENGGGPAQGDYFGGGAAPQQQQSQNQPRHAHIHPHGPDNVMAPVEIGTRSSLRGRPSPAAAHVRMDSHGSEADGSQSELADTSSRGPSPSFGGSGGGPASPVESIAGRFELYGDFGPGGMATATAASGNKDEFYDAQESVGGNRSRGTAMGGSGPPLPQPFPTPGSEMSEFATPSPLSREEERRN